MMKYISTIILLFFMFNAAQASNTLAEFTQLESSWVGLIKQGDKAALSDLLNTMIADDFVYQHGSGQNLDKNTYVKLLLTDGITVEKLGELELRVRDYGDVVISYGISDMAGKVFYEHSYDGQLRFVNIWKKATSGDWQLHHRNSELLPKER